MTKIRGSRPSGFEIDCKRLYLPGVVLEGDCPKCGEPATTDLGDQYLSYPTVGSRESVGLCCEECGEDWTVAVVLSVSIRLAAK